MIARRRALRVAEGKSRVAAVETASIDDLATDPADTSADSPLDLVIRAEQQEAVRALFAHLAPDYKIVLLLFYYEQWPAVRIATFLSLPLTTIKWRLRYGRKQLTPHLTRLLGEQIGEETDKQAEEQIKAQESPPKRREEKTNVRSRAEERDTPNAHAAGQNGRDWPKMSEQTGSFRAAFTTLLKRYNTIVEHLEDKGILPEDIFPRLDEDFDLGQAGRGGQNVVRLPSGPLGRRRGTCPRARKSKRRRQTARSGE